MTKIEGENLIRDKNPSSTVITTHLNADFDALSSMIAAKKLYPEAILAFPGSQEKNLRNFFLHSTSYLFNFTKIKNIDFDQINKLILVDTCLCRYDRETVLLVRVLRSSVSRIMTYQNLS